MQPINDTEAAKRLAAQKYLEEYDKTPDNYVRGMLGALAGALAGALPWALLGAGGLIHMWLALFMVILVSRSYDQFKGKSDMVKLFIVIGATVVGIVAGEIMCQIMTIAVDKELTAYLMDRGINILEFYIYNFGEYLRVGMINVGIGCLFAAPTVIKLWFDIRKEQETMRKLRETAGQYLTAG